jgi:malate dehydrogenase (oxaloacetate-decarboxylating)(NADP+)
MGLDEDSLEYHRSDPPGKLEISTTKPTNTQRDLSLAYSPGVAAPCNEIAENPEDAYTYTTKGNLVGVVSNGTAVLGLGDIGAQASKPVMEGKGVLFKRFADIDVFDVELDQDDPKDIIRSVRAMEPTFGGINLEDIKAPECFEVEETLREEMDVPVFHDDQHGTAIISGAALLNAAEIAGKQLAELDVVFSGAGASALASARFYVSLGVDRDNITMCDSSGIITERRAEEDDVNEFKKEFAQDLPEGGLEDAMEGADVFVGLSIGGLVDREMVRSMADDPIIFAMANPDPEIAYEAAKEARDDTVIMATGRSDYPNQVNNVLGFPFIFRGALDVRATEINEEMKVAAAEALADLAKQDVPDAVVKAYGDQPLQFGPEYIIPKPLDPRVLFEVAPAVAQAAMTSDAARRNIDLQEYVEQLEARLGKSREMMRVVLNKAKSDPKRLVLAEGDDEKMVRAAYQLVEREIAEPILVGRARHLGTGGRPRVGLRPRDGRPDERRTRPVRRAALRTPPAEGHHPPRGRLPRPRRQLPGERDARDGRRRRDADGTDEPLPVGAAAAAAGGRHRRGRRLRRRRLHAHLPEPGRLRRRRDGQPGARRGRPRGGRRPHGGPREEVQRRPPGRAAVVSDFGSVRNEGTRKPREAARRLREDPEVDFPVDGEMQADTAVVEEILEGTYSFSELDDPANVLVFPNLEAGNIAYKLLQRLGGAEAIGPMLVGMDKPVHVLQRGDEVKDIVNLAGVAVVDAQ